MYISGNIGLGHRRLSIIDLDGGAQPITNETQTLHLVFNGEIYNYIELREELSGYGHIFKTKSDTEVIVHGYEEWGEDCVNRFNGIFTIAIWDSVEKNLFIARDHLGVKPLYYYLMDDKFLFASEIKAILTDTNCGREVDIPALGQLFTYRYVPSPKTLFKGIYKLPPGHILKINKMGTEIKRFWVVKPVIQVGRNEKALVEQYQWLLEDAIRMQLRSDVPVGLFLSSGIDSAAILAIMRKHISGPIHTFTIGFEDGEKTNETNDARHFALQYGTEHEEMIVRASDYEKYYDRYLWDLEEPVGNESAAAFYFVSLIASKKVKVALSGQGADEPWAGYNRHIGVKLSNMYSRMPGYFTERILKKLVFAFPRNELLKRGVTALHEPDLLRRFEKIYSFYSEEMKGRLFQDWVKEILRKNNEDPLRRLQADVLDLDPLSQMLYIDTRANLPDDLLMVGDKTSMANSIEARVPYLDYRLVEFIESLPPDLKLNRFRGKYLHKKALEKWLPHSVVYREKKGFSNPVDKWLRGRLANFINDHLLGESSSTREYFDGKYVRELIARHRSGQEDYMRHLNLLVSFELWHKSFIAA
jgi:asparagine synthase (glutamine-hydrolysing)